ncbi:MAG TPA: flavodoxin family protein [Spirochaetia bacterium]|nr:flavodoxin family protein [Spirochaetia bacterium]
MKPINCVALSTSPRMRGNSDTLARQALAGARACGGDTELLRLADFRYEPCRACGGCYGTGVCVIPDQAADIFAHLLAADRVILAAPIFSMGICAQAKAIIDRAQRFWATRHLLHRRVIEKPGQRPQRRGIFISTAGSNLPGVFDGVLPVVRYFFKMLEIEPAGVYCYRNLEEKGDAAASGLTMAQVFLAGQKLVRE